MQVVARENVGVYIYLLVPADHDEEAHHADEEILEPGEVVEPDGDHANIWDEGVSAAHYI